MKETPQKLDTGTLEVPKKKEPLKSKMSKSNKMVSKSENAFSDDEKDNKKLLHKNSKLSKMGEQEEEKRLSVFSSDSDFNDD